MASLLGLMDDDNESVRECLSSLVRTRRLQAVNITIKAESTITTGQSDIRSPYLDK